MQDLKSPHSGFFKQIVPETPSVRLRSPLLLGMTALSLNLMVGSLRAETGKQPPIATTEMQQPQRIQTPAAAPSSAHPTEQFLESSHHALLLQDSPTSASTPAPIPTSIPASMPALGAIEAQAPLAAPDIQPTQSPATLETVLPPARSTAPLPESSRHASSLGVPSLSASMSASMSASRPSASRPASRPTLSVTSVAQLSPDLDPPSREPIPEPPAPAPLPSPENLFPTPPPIPERTFDPIDPSGESPDGVTGAFVVERFEVVGSSVFTPEELAKELESFTQRPISFVELLEARSQITKFYTDQGYLTSGAFLPEQELQGGVVRIQVVEGEVEAIEVTGTRRLNPNYVRKRIARAAKKPLNVNHLIEALQLLRQDPLIENLSTELSASPRPGQSLLKIQVKESKSFTIQARLDNGRSPSVGSFRRLVRVSEGNLSGQGDTASVSYTNTDGSNALDLSYVRPIGPQNDTLRFAFGVTASDVIEPPFNLLDIESDSRYYELTYRRPLLQTPTQEFALGLTFSRQESETELLDIPFPLSAGADLEGRTRISAVRFFQEFTQRSERQVLALRSQFSVGLDALGSTINQSLPEDPFPTPDSRFFSWRGQAQWVRQLAPDTLFLLRGDIQLANKVLVPLEQFGIGGFDRLRGYRQDVLLTDNGAFASAEFRIPILRQPSWQGLIQIAPFIDWGSAWNVGENDPDTSTLVSVGLGLRMQLGDRFNARLDWGMPLVSMESSERTWQENGILFSMTYQLF